MTVVLRRQPKDKALVRSDQGGQYPRNDYLDLIKTIL